MNHPSNKHDEWAEENKRKIESYKDGRSQITRNGENSTVNSGSKNNLTLSSKIQSALCTDCVMYQSDITIFIGLKTSQNRGSG